MAPEYPRIDRMAICHDIAPLGSIWVGPWPFGYVLQYAGTYSRNLMGRSTGVVVKIKLVFIK